jgi:hypothetical protein
MPTCLEDLSSILGIDINFGSIQSLRTSYGD